MDGKHVLINSEKNTGIKFSFVMLSLVDVDYFKRRNFCVFAIFCLIYESFFREIFKNA